MQFMIWVKQLRKEKDWSGIKKKGKKPHEGPTRRIQKTEKKIKELKIKIERKKEEDWKEINSKKEILQKLKRWADKQLNRNEEIIYVKEKRLINEDIVA